MKTFTILLILLNTITVAIAQTGPGAPPAAESPGIPIDGGITAFLAAAGLAGVWIISKFRKEKN